MAREFEVYIDTSTSKNSTHWSNVSRNDVEIEESEFAADIFAYLKHREVSLCF